MLRRSLCVEDWAFRKWLSKSPLVEQFRAWGLGANVEIRRLEYLWSGNERREPRRLLWTLDDRIERLFMSTGSDKPTPRDERYGGGGTNDVYYTFIITRSFGRPCHMHRGVLVLLWRRIVSYVTAWNKEDVMKEYMYVRVTLTLLIGLRTMYNFLQMRNIFHTIQRSLTSGKLYTSYIYINLHLPWE